MAQEDTQSSLGMLWRVYRLGLAHRKAFILMPLGMGALGLLNMGITYLMYPMLKAMGHTLGVMRS